MPEKVSINNPESSFSPLLKTALIAVGGIAISSILANCAFSGAGYKGIDDRDPYCRMTGIGGNNIPLHAAHIFHDDGVLGGYNCPENGVKMTSWAHGFQHWLIYKWGVSPEFGLRPVESLNASIACLGTRGRAFDSKGGGKSFPMQMTPLKEVDLLRIALFNASWLLGLQGVCLGTSGQVIGHFMHGLDHKVDGSDWAVPLRGEQSPKLAPPAAVIVHHRPLTVEERLDEVERAKGKLNGNGRWIVDNFIRDPVGGVRKNQGPNVESLIARYRDLVD